MAYAHMQCIKGEQQQRMLCALHSVTDDDDDDGDDEVECNAQSNIICVWLKQINTTTTTKTHKQKIDVQLLFVLQFFFSLDPGAVALIML